MVNVIINDQLTGFITQLGESLKKYYANNPLEYLDTRQAAAYLGLSRQRLEIWRCYGGGPRYSKLAQAVRYKKSDLDDFMAACTKSHTAEK